MLYRDPKLGQHPAEVKWSGRVLAEPDPDRGVHRIRLEDGAQLLLPDTAALAANLLTLWLDLEAAQNPGEDGELLHRPLPLKQALAEGEVRFLSHDVAVDRANRIDVQLELGTLAETSQDSQNGLTSSANEGSEPHDPFRVGCDELTLNLIHDPVIAKIDLQEVHGNGHVRLQYNPEKSTSVGQVDVDGPLVLTGIQLHAVNQGENRQKLTLSGETGEYGEVKVPASMEFGGASILGAELVVEREQNIMRVNGPGKFIVPISEDLEGNALQSPTDMEVVWSEGMVFDGQQANFFGSCKASLADGNTISRLNCEKLTVVLNERISFTDPESQPKDLQLAQFTAEHHVRLEIREFEGIHVVGLRIAELARFTLNQISGDFEGRDGYLDNWTRGDLVRFTSTPEAQANQPAKIASPKWRFTHVEFKGQLIGNMGRREAELHDDVVLVSAPVSNAMVKFDIDDQLGEDTEQAANAVSLKCQVLRIVQQEVGNVYYSTITATGKSTTLEGQSFQANADELIFDERLGRFTLRGIGRDVTLFFQRSAMEPWTPSRHRVIMFTPATKAISFGGSSGISGQF